MGKPTAKIFLESLSVDRDKIRMCLKGVGINM